MPLRNAIRAAILAPALAARALAADTPGPPPAPPPARIEVTRTIQLGDGIQDAQFAPDGRTIYLVVEEEVVWVGELLIEHRRAILGIGFLAVATPVGWAMLRIIRLPRRAGAFHCRGCNYDVSAHLDPDSLDDRHPRPKSQARCPECGADLAKARPVRGRTMRARLAVPLIILIITAGAAGYGSTPHAVRVLGATRFGSWTSRWLGAWNQRHRIDPLLYFSRAASRIARADIESGRDETLLRTYPNARISVAPTGEKLLLTWSGGRRAQIRDVSTGRLIRQTDLLGRARYLIYGSAVSDWAEDGSVAYIPWWNDPGEPSGLTALNASTGDVKTIWSAQTPLGLAGIGEQEIMRISRPPALLLWTNDRARSTPTEVRLIRPGSTELAFTLPGPLEPASRPAVTTDGRTAYFAMDEGLILAIDTSTGRIRRQISTLEGARRGLFLVNQDRRLAVCSSRSIYLLDLLTGEWTYQLIPPEEDPFKSIESVTVCDGWAAALYERFTVMAGAPPPCDLLLWKLPPLDPAAPE